jgi:hypothetical protein
LTRALVIAALVWLTGAAVAHASDTTVIDKRRDVKATGLSDPQRRAIDIARVNATGGRYGVIVDVLFGGDAEAALGRRTSVAVVLHRRGGARTTVSARGERVVRRRETFQFFALGVTGVRRIEVRVIIRGRIVDSATVPPPSSSPAAGCVTLARRIDDLRFELVRDRLIDAWRDVDCRQEVVVLSSGYEHRPGAAVVCADARPFPDLGEPLAFALFSYDEKVAEGDADGAGRVQATVTAEGRYRLEIFTRDDPEIATSVNLDVVAPPPAVTKVCG